MRGTQIERAAFPGESELSRLSKYYPGIKLQHHSKENIWLPVIHWQSVCEIGPLQSCVRQN